MEWKTRYEKAKQKLLGDSSICSANRKLFERFFTYEEYKLRRQNGLATLDAGCCKTLIAYTSRLRVVNHWFKNKAWVDLTRRDIKAVYDGLEDGTIHSRFGKPIKDKRSYYNRVIRSKPFELAGKLDLVKEVMEFVSNGKKEDVRFIREETFREIAGILTNVEQRCFLWLCWDIGENAASLLQLSKRDCTRQTNPYTQQPEYLINLRHEILKRRRKPRGELTNYRETVQYLDRTLKNKADDDMLFNFGTRWAAKFLATAAKKVGARCLPAGQAITLKDLRSSMACDLLSKAWSHDEVNARLGQAQTARLAHRGVTVGTGFSDDFGRLCVRFRMSRTKTAPAPHEVHSEAANADIALQTRERRVCSTIQSQPQEIQYREYYAQKEAE